MLVSGWLFTTVLRTSEFWWCELGLFIFTKFKLKGNIFKHKSTYLHSIASPEWSAHHTSMEPLRNFWALTRAWGCKRQLISKHCYKNNSLSESILGTPRGTGPHFGMCQSRVWPCVNITIERGIQGWKRRNTGTIYVNTEITRSMLEVGLEQVIVSGSYYGQRPQRVTATRRSHGFCVVSAWYSKFRIFRKEGGMVWKKQGGQRDLLLLLQECVGKQPPTERAQGGSDCVSCSKSSFQASRDGNS